MGEGRTRHTPDVISELAEAVAAAGGAIRKSRMTSGWRNASLPLTCDSRFRRSRSPVPDRLSQDEVPISEEMTCG